MERHALETAEVREQVAAKDACGAGESTRPATAWRKHKRAITERMGLERA